jgi:hypothetical protein
MLARPLLTTLSVLTDDDAEPDASAPIAVLATLPELRHLLPYRLPSGVYRAAARLRTPFLKPLGQRGISLYLNYLRSLGRNADASRAEFDELS